MYCIYEVVVCLVNHYLNVDALILCTNGMLPSSIFVNNSNTYLYISHGVFPVIRTSLLKAVSIYVE